MRCTTSPLLLLMIASLVILASAGGRDGHRFNPRTFSSKVMNKAATLIHRRSTNDAPPARLQIEPHLVPIEPPLPEPDLHPLIPEPPPPELEIPYHRINAFPLQPDLSHVVIECSYGHSYSTNIVAPPDMVLTTGIRFTGLLDDNDHAGAFRREIEGHCNETNLATYEPRETLERDTLSVTLQIIVALEGDFSTNSNCVDNAIREFSGRTDFRHCRDHGW